MPKPENLPEPTPPKPNTDLTTVPENLSQSGGGLLLPLFGASLFPRFLPYLNVAPENLPQFITALLACKILEPTAEELGQDLRKAYSMLRDHLVKVANKVEAKSKPEQKGHPPNKRVSYNALRESLLTSDPIAHEYLSGLIANSRSPDGKDDSKLHLLELLHGLPSNQIRLHYRIYQALNRLLAADAQHKNLNINDIASISEIKLYINDADITTAEVPASTLMDINNLHEKGLIEETSITTGDGKASYRTTAGTWNPKKGGLGLAKNPEGSTSEFDYLQTRPTSLGIYLYAVAHNEDPEDFTSKEFDPFPDIPVFEHAELSLEALEKSLQRQK